MFYNGKERKVINMKILILLTSVCVLLTGCGKVNDKASNDEVSSETATPSGPCVIRDSDHSIVTSDGRISESFEYYFKGKNTVAVDVTVTNNSDREVGINCTPHFWAETDLTPKDFSLAFTQPYPCTYIDPGESIVETYEYSELEDGWSSCDIHLRLFCDLNHGYYDPSEMDFDFTVNYDDVDWQD